jgi:hypothetical protein
VRKIRAVCMYCRRGAMYVVTEQCLHASHYSADDLCACGLPLDHEQPHLDPPFVRRQKSRKKAKEN